VARSLNHHVVANIDGNMVDAAGARTKEDKITSLALRKRVLGSIVVLGLSIMIETLASALVDTVEGKTTAVKTNNVAIIAIGLDVLLDTLGGTASAASTPRVRIFANHALGSTDNARCTVDRSLSSGAHSKHGAHSSKECRKITHFTTKNRNGKSKKCI